jgi:hypothetical protein
MPTELSAYLLQPSLEPPPPAVIRAAKLEGYVYATLDATHALRATLKPGALEAAARHALRQKQFAALLHAWNHRGIEPLVFKGFALAAFVYPQPGMRFYGDIDALLSLEDARVATRIALSIGWTQTDNLDDDAIGFDHEYTHLFSPDKAVRIDLHLEVLQTDRPSRKRARFTQTIADAAQPHTLKGARLRVPAPVDHAIALLTNRRWGDRWARKASDLLDLRALGVHGVTREALLERAGELGCAATVALTLETCDPWRGKLDLTMPTRLEKFRRDWRVRHDLGSYEVDYYLERLIQAPSRIAYVLRALPVLREAMRARDAGGDLHALLAHFDSPPLVNAKPTHGRRLRWMLGVHWAAVALRLKHNPCVPKSLAMFRLLSREGFAVSFVSGVRRNGAKLEGHAWVELDGNAIDFRDDTLRHLYTENLRYPNALLRARAASSRDPTVERVPTATRY